jgi:hypothetical protein
MPDVPQTPQKAKEGPVMFRGCVGLLVAAGMMLFTTPLWWVPAVGGLALAVFCFGQAGG